MRENKFSWLAFCLSVLVLIASQPLLSAAPLDQARGSPVAYRINYGAAVPATCQVATGDVFYVNAGANLGLYQCTAANTWTTVGARGAGVIFLGGPGAVGGPTYSFLADPDTGIYNTGANQLGFSTTGVQRMNVNAALGVDTTIPVRGPAGAVGAPTFSFTGDATTGIYDTAVGQLGFSTGGVQRLNINAAGGLDATIPFRGPDGAVGAPAFAFTGETNSGAYLAGAAIVRFAVAGVQRLELNADGPLIPVNSMLQFTGVPFAALGAPANGFVVYCPDCVIGAVCAGAGTGAIAKRLAGAWVCN